MAESSPKDSTQELDLELVRRVQRGDSAAFDLLVRKYQHRITALIGRYVADWSECQDVAQETFLRAYRALGNFRGDAQFYTWLHRIAVNTAKNHLVVHNRCPPTDDIDASDAEQYDLGTRLRDTDTPEREAMREELERTVMKAVACGANSYSGDMRQTRKTPAVTMVAAWIRADIGVGPSIESGSQTCSGNCADLPIAPMNRQMHTTVSSDHSAAPSRFRVSACMAGAALKTSA